MNPTFKILRNKKYVFSHSFSSETRQRLHLFFSASNVLQLILKAYIDLASIFRKKSKFGAHRALQPILSGLKKEKALRTCDLRPMFNGLWVWNLVRNRVRILPGQGKEFTNYNPDRCLAATEVPRLAGNGFLYVFSKGQFCPNQAGLFISAH